MANPEDDKTLPAEEKPGSKAVEVNEWENPLYGTEGYKPGVGVKQNWEGADSEGNLYRTKPEYRDTALAEALAEALAKLDSPKGEAGWDRLGKDLLDPNKPFDEKIIPLFKFKEKENK